MGKTYVGKLFALLSLYYILLRHCPPKQWIAFLLFHSIIGGFFITYMSYALTAFVRSSEFLIFPLTVSLQMLFGASSDDLECEYVRRTQVCLSVDMQNNLYAYI